MPARSREARSWPVGSRSWATTMTFRGSRLSSIPERTPRFAHTSMSSGSSSVFHPVSPSSATTRRPSMESAALAAPTGRAPGIPVRSVHVRRRPRSGMTLKPKRKRLTSVRWLKTAASRPEALRTGSMLRSVRISISTASHSRSSTPSVVTSRVATWQTRGYRSSTMGGGSAPDSAKTKRDWGGRGPSTAGMTRPS